ncbi:MAG: RimJ/RimL family protein N-acetyltransferase [Saprospiraceae bacterium]|jgi:RimJ/RimL family protein N-acetyltransferase
MQALDFTQNIVLENNRVLLRPIEAGDFDFLLPYSINEPTLWQYSLTPANGPENLKKYIDFALEKREKKDCYPFIVFDKQTQKYAGSTRFYDYQETHKTVQLGYTWFGSEFWGTGLNQNCKYLMLSHAFETVGMQRVEFRADNDNKRSISAMKRLGCTKEGVLRNNCAAANGSRRDSIVLSILKSEWTGGIKKSLETRIT